MARATMRRGGDETLVPGFRFRGVEGTIEIDALDRDERFINGLAMTATLTGPDRVTRSLELEPAAPGRYRADFPVPGTGRYFVNVSGRRGELQVGPRTFGVAVPYSPEYLDLGVDRTLLADIARITGGELLALSPASLPALLAPPPESVTLRARVWWPFLLAALILLVLEVAVRKLPWPERWQRSGDGGEASGGLAPDPYAPEAPFPRAGDVREMDRVRLRVAGGRR